MKKKLLFVMTLIAAAIFMVSCGNKTASLDGEYYFYADYRNGISKSPWVVIEGKTLTYYSGGKDKPSGTLRFSIDFEKKTKLLLILMIKKMEFFLLALRVVMLNLSRKILRNTKN